MSKTDKELTAEIVIAMIQVAPGQFRFPNSDIVTKMISDIHSTLQSLKEDQQTKISETST